MPYPIPRDEAIRFRGEVTAPGEEFDQTSFELSPVPSPISPADGQPELFADDCSQPDLSACTAQADAAAGEPVFWAASGSQSLPADDSVQPDLSACSAQAGAPE